MSKIQEALRKLQGPGDLSVRKPGKDEKKSPKTPIPLAHKQAAEFAGEKHHLDLNDLIKSGLMVPQSLAATVADEFRRIKRPLIDNALRQGPTHEDHLNLIMVASPLPGAGKTFCSVNLAVSISLERELSVLLVDGDVAKPHISTAFGLADRPGLLDVLENDGVSVDDVLVRTDLNDIQVLPAGRMHSQSTELLASERMEAVVHDLATRYQDRLIVLDSPPLMITSEAQALARQVGQIALIVESGKTANQDIREALGQLDPNKAINLILNKSLYSQTGGYYGSDFSQYGADEEY